MTEDELRELIRETIIELLAPQRALVLFTGALLGFDDATAELKRVMADGIELDYIQTPTAKQILDQEKIRAIGMTEAGTDLLRRHQMLIIPTLTGNIAAKAAHGIADCLASNLFAEFIMADRPIVAARTASCPDAAEKRAWYPSIPAGYAARLRANLAELASYGVELTDAKTLHLAVMATWHRRLGGPTSADIAATVAAGAVEPAAVAARPAIRGSGSAAATATPVTCPLSLISQQVIRTLPPGTELRISPRARVTALARDTAASRSIRIAQSPEV